MRLVGANAVFIRVPFTVEAILSGIAGSVLAYLLVCGLMYFFGPRLAASFSDTVSTASSYFYLIQPYFDAISLNQRIGFWSTVIGLWPLGALQVVIGILFSISCSMLAIRRYLRF
jgi:cell division protein FtsX